MLEKTIKQVLTKKVNAWINTITDNNVVSLIKKDLIITGGCIPSLMQNEEPKDIDVYFKTKETVLAVSNYYVNLWNSNHKAQENKLHKKTKVFVLDGANPSSEILDYYHIKDLEDSRAVMISNTSKDRVKIIFPSDGIVGDTESINSDETLGIDVLETIEEIDEVKADEIIEKEPKQYFPVFLSTNAITLSNGIQIVVRFYGEPSMIHETYDFEHTKSYFDYSVKELVIPARVYELVHNKTLIYSGSLYPVCSVFRLRKFIKRGWNINAGQIVKMCMQISQLDLMDINVLEDQLIGVDSVYFMNLIYQFREKQLADPSWELTTSYLLSVIDKIF